MKAKAVQNEPTNPAKPDKHPIILRRSFDFGIRRSRKAHKPNPNHQPGTPSGASLGIVDKAQRARPTHGRGGERMNDQPIPVFRADVPPLGETYSGATVQAVQTGEIITLDIEFYRATKTRVVMTWEQAKALTEQLKDATAAAAACRLERESVGVTHG